jgi:diguanylate cyclase (GGDEF)-like protein
LRLFGAVIGKNMRATDVIGRLGGEEFAAIVPGGATEAAGAAERVRSAFEFSRLVVEGHRVPVTVSIGIAAASEKAEIHFLLGRADTALYLAKRRGRNQWAAAGEATPASRATDQVAATATDRELAVGAAPYGRAA